MSLVEWYEHGKRHERIRIIELLRAESNDCDCEIPLTHLLQRIEGENNE